MADTLPALDFVPQTVTPPEKPLGLVRGLLQMIDNPLYVWPRAMYENPYHGVKWLGRTFHYFRKPEHMKAVFLDHTDVFRKSPFQKKLVGIKENVKVSVNSCYSTWDVCIIQTKAKVEMIFGGCQFLEKIDLTF